MFTFKDVNKLTCSHTPIFGVDEYLNKNKETKCFIRFLEGIFASVLKELYK